MRELFHAIIPDSVFIEGVGYIDNLVLLIDFNIESNDPQQYQVFNFKL